jgi:hypothetical protein
MSLSLLPLTTAISVTGVPSNLPSRSFGLMNHIDGMVDAAAMFDDPKWL